MNKRIGFCFPVIAKTPTGGYKVVFEYANRLVERGYAVDLYFDCSTHLTKYKIPNELRMLLCKIMTAYYPTWFKMNHKVKKIAVDGISEGNIKDSDIIFATAIETSAAVNSLLERKGKKYYLIQDFENWEYPDQFVLDSYKYNMCNIAISKWLCTMVKNASGNCFYIPNAINTEAFKVVNPIQNRNDHSIMLLYHEGEHKGLKYAFKVIERLKTVYDDLSVYMFGTPKRPCDLPSWFHYKRNASESELVELYNKSAVFLCASVNEGFGLTGLESMACGCALVSTSYKGVMEYAVHNENALLTSVRDVEGLYRNVIELFENPDVRIRIASQGTIDAQKFSWKRTIDKLESVLNIEQN